MALSKENRLKGKKAFSQVFVGTRPLISPHYSIRVSRDAASVKSRFAIVVPAKTVALATTRNLLRRRTSEALARIIRNTPVVPGARVVVSVKTPKLPTVTVIEQELLSLMKKSGIV